MPIAASFHEHVTSALCFTLFICDTGRGNAHRWSPSEDTSVAKRL